MEDNKVFEQTVPQKSPPVSHLDPEAVTPEQTRVELNDAIKGSNQVLVSAKTALTVFPDTVCLDRAKLSVTKRTFVSTAELVSIRIEDILNVTAVVGPFLGSIEIASRIMNSGPYKIGKFWRGDALKIKRITQGYVIALQRNIDCHSLQTKELAGMLDKLGEDDHANSAPIR